MSIRQSVLALLSRGPRYGALLKAEFEAHTGGAWPLNVGQVYTTLARLERDGLVLGDARADDEGRIAYRITDAGRGEVQRWWQTPVDRDEPPRDELAIKLALAIADPELARIVLQAQRSSTMRLLQSLTRAKIHASQSVTERLLLEHRLFAVEAELRWLDHVEATLDTQRDGAHPRPPTTTGTTTKTTTGTTTGTTTATSPITATTGERS